MWVDTSVLHVDHLPKIRLDAGTDWVALSGFILTAVVVVLGTWVTIYTYRKTLKSQEAISRAVALASNRQEWINTLRTTCSDYVAAVMTIQRLNNMSEGRLSHLTALNDVAPDEASRQTYEWSNSHITAINLALALRAKIKLMLNPAEAKVKLLLTHIENAYENCDKAGIASHIHCDHIISSAQEILKDEWEVLKLEWKKASALNK